MNEYIYEQETFLIRGAAFEVYTELGCGFVESVYQEALEKELRKKGIPFESQKEIRVCYKGEQLDQFFKADIVCYDSIIVELKAVRNLSDEHKAQLFNYLKATGSKLGLLMNFGHFPKMEIERIAH